MTHTPHGLNLTEQREEPGRRQSDLGSEAGMPWQVRAVAIIGIPGAIACFVVWLMATRITDAQDRMEKVLAPHVAVSEKLGMTLEQLEGDHRNSNARMERYMRLMCVQASKNDQQRDACLDVR